MADKEKIQEVDETYKEAYSSQDQMLREFELDDGMYLGGALQWNQDDINTLIDEDRPVISINKTKKPCDMVNGYYRQNKLDLKFFPVESGDQESADIYTEVSKWIMETSDARENIAVAFGDQSRVGLGWTSCEMNYDTDPLYGDIRVDFGDKYKFLFDPYAKSPDPNVDWDYILRHAWLSKSKAISLYPDKEKEIKKIKSNASTSKFITQSYTGVQDRGIRVNVIEKWYPEREKITVLIDPSTLESYEWKGGKKKFKQIMEAHPEWDGKISMIEANVPRMKLISVLDDTVLLYDDYPPEGFSRTLYPFFPSFCYYVPNFNDWGYKVQGMVRSMRDPQTEYNKMRSILVDTAMTSLHSGWIYETTAVPDPDQLDKTGAGQKIEVNPGKGLGAGLWPINPPQLNTAIAQIHELYSNDFIAIGPNADLLGMIGSDGSSIDASGVALQLRAKQGLMSIQNPFDGIAFTHRLIGRYMIEMINRWSDAKIQRIIGRPLPKTWERYKKSGRYDCIPDSKTSSATYQLASYAQLQALVQHGMPIPPQVMREVADIPARIKQIWTGIETQQAQQAMQERQFTQQLEMAKLKMMSDSPIKEEAVKQKGTKEVTIIKQRGAKEIEQMREINKLAIERMKLKEKPQASKNA